MRGWSSIIVGVALLALAAWCHLANISSGGVIFFGLAGAFLLFRGFQGVEITEAGDPTALGEFISNPAEALVEAATDQAGEWMSNRKADSPDQAVPFDADAALARYMANRPQGLPEAAPAAAPPPVRGFGRKGL